MTSPTEESLVSIYIKSKLGLTPLSIGYLSNFLLKLGLTEEESFEHAVKIATKILEINKPVIKAKEVYNIILAWYKQSKNKFRLRLMLSKNDFSYSKPIIIILGGVTGVGKSSIARTLAKRLNIRTIHGTDFIREIIRLVISEQLIPSLHQSSYNAYRRIYSVPIKSHSLIIQGFEEQARKVIAGVEAVIYEAVKNNEFIILEGVHLVPGMLNTNAFPANIIPFQLVLDNREDHFSRLKGRENVSTLRTNYTNFFEEIREIQAYLRDLANKYKISTVEVKDEESAVVSIINTIWDKLLERANLPIFQKI